MFTYPPGWVSMLSYVRFRAMGKQFDLETKLEREPGLCLHATVPVS